jgi:hypothetical protein
MAFPSKHHLKLYDIRMQYETKEDWTWVKVNAKTPLDIDCLTLELDDLDASKIELRDSINCPQSPMSFVLVFTKLIYQLEEPNTSHNFDKFSLSEPKVVTRFVDGGLLFRKLMDQKRKPNSLFPAILPVITIF